MVPGTKLTTFFIGLISIIKNKERSIFVFLATAKGTLYFCFSGYCDRIFCSDLGVCGNFVPALKIIIVFAPIKNFFVAVLPDCAMFFLSIN